MGSFLQISGIAGIVLTVFGLVAFLFTQNINDPYVRLHLILGVLFLFIFLLTRGSALFGSLRRRSARYGMHSVFYSLLFLGVLIMLNFLSTRPRYHYRWDLTESRVFSLSPQSIKVVEDLQQDIEVYAFFERGRNRRISDLIRGYTYHSPRIKFQSIDPDRHPEMAKKFKVKEFNSLHIRYDGDSTNLTEITEKAITNAIVKLTRTGKKNVYFITGHGEPGMDDRRGPRGYGGVKEALENENYQVAELLLPSVERVPDDASLVLLAGPRKPIFRHETKALGEYLRSGGRLLILLPSQEDKDLTGFLEEWGVDAGNDIVIDQVIRLFSGPSLGVHPIANTYDPSHPITRNFKERTIFPMVRSVNPAKELKDGLTTTSVVKTSPTSWAEKDLDGVFKRGKASLGPEDDKGPISVGVAVTADLKKIGVDKKGDAKLVVLGAAAFANNQFLRNFFNRDLLLNAANWLVGHEGLITIRPRTFRASRVQLTEAEGNMIFYLSFLILPELLLIMGLSVWWRRR